MGLWCNHQWEVLTTDHHAPSRFKLSGYPSEDLVNDLVYGYTVVSLRCGVCSDVKTKKLVGQWRDGFTD